MLFRSEAPALGARREKLEIPEVDLCQVSEAAFGEGTKQVQCRGRLMVGSQHAPGIGHSRGRSRRVVVDDVTPEHRQLDLANELRRRRARLGELPGDAADFHDRDTRAVGEDDRHLQDDLQLVADRVGREVVEGLGTVAGLEQERLAGGDSAERASESARLAGKHERWERRELGKDLGAGDGIGPWWLMGSGARVPRGRVPTPLRHRRWRRRSGVVEERLLRRIRCCPHLTSVRSRESAPSRAGGPADRGRPVTSTSRRYASLVSGFRRLGILGGTFDPVHVGHLVAAVNARHELGLDRVLLVVANEPWQKVGNRPVTPAADRLALVEAAVEGVDGLESSGIEIERGGPSYTSDTVAELEARWPGVELNLIVGADAAAGLGCWERIAEVRSKVVLVVVNRPGTTIDASGPDSPLEGWDVRMVEVPALEISSTDLRDRVASGRPLDFLVPMPAIHVIRQRGLYPVPR